MIKLMASGKFSKKRCVIFLSFYSLCIIFLSTYLKNKLGMNKYENCTIQNMDILEMERNLTLNIDIHFKKLLQDNVNDIMPVVSQKWTQMASNIYVYSVFFEMCPSELLSSKYCIKFLGIVLSNFTSVSTIQCAVKKHSVVSQEVATIEILPENHDKLFSAAFLFCPAKMNYPTHATVYKNNSFNFTWLPVEYHKLSSKHYQNIFSEDNSDLHVLNFSQGINLCVRPLYNDFVSVHFMEFLAYYLVMGVDHFTFYYQKSFKPLEIFIKFLKFSNVSSEVFLWDIPLDNDLIHEYGQIAFTQDCLARSKINKFRYAIIVDLDEYLVPKAHNNIKSLISYLDEKNVNAGSYVIPMVLFCNEYSIQNSHISPFHILNHNKRQKTHWQHHYRSKYIVRLDRIRYSGIHFAWKLENSFEEVFVSPNIALLNHYRLCCGMAQTWFFHLFDFKVLNDNVVVDDTLINHMGKLKNNLFKFINIPFDVNIF